MFWFESAVAIYFTDNSGGSQTDTESMWPDEMIQRYARTETSNENAYSTTLNKIKVQRYDVRKVLRELNTLPAQGYLFGYSTVPAFRASSAESRVSYTLLRLKLLAG